MPENEARTPSPTVSVVIATYNRRETLGGVLTPLLSDPSALEIVVVIDGSHDGSLELLQEIARTDARLKPLAIENRGKMGARQAGVEAAVGDVVLLLDDDVIAGPNLVQGHARAQFETPPHTVVVGYMPTHVPEKRSRDSFTTELYARAYENRCDEYVRDPSTVLRDLWMGNLSMSRADCLSVGIVSASYTAKYHADRDFGLRCIKAGYRGVFDKGLLATHSYERTVNQFLSDALNQGRGTALMHRLHGDVLGPMDESRLTDGMPLPARMLVRASRNESFRSAMTPLITMGTRIAGATHLCGAQRRMGQLLRRIEFQRGILEGATTRSQ
jgi:glycosyltransferase involved in cell wall biosynthesis